MKDVEGQHCLVTAGQHFVVEIQVFGCQAQNVHDPDFPKGPCMLVLERDKDGHHIHAVWGIPKTATSPAVLITAYRPEPALWTDDFRRRK